MSSNDQIRSQVFEAICERLQDAEEIGGPEGEAYSGLMCDIAEEVVNRLEGFFSHEAATAADQDRLVRLRDRLSELCASTGVEEA